MIEPETILFVDDEPAVLSAFQRQFRGSFRLETATSGASALERVANGEPIAVLVADMQMPQMNGADLLAEVRRRSPSTVRIMLTGNSDQTTAVRAVNDGQIFRFLSKPCAPDELTAALRAGLEMHRAQRLEKDLLERTLNGAVRVMTDIVAALDPAAFERASELRSVVARAGATLELEALWRVELAAMVLDLGVVTLPAEVARRYLRAEAMSPAERELAASIPQISARLIAHIPRLEPVSALLDSLARPGSPADAPEIALLRAGNAYVRERGTPPAVLARLRVAMPRLDERALDAIEETVLGADAATAEAAILEVTLAELRPSMFLAAPIETADGRPLLGAGAMINAVTLERVRNHAKLNGVREPIRIYDARPEAVRRRSAPKPR